MFCLLSVLILSLSVVCVRSVQLASFRFLAAESIDLGLYSLFGQYDKELLEEYDMFFLDASYGSGQLQLAQVIQMLENYTNDTLQAENDQYKMKQSGFTEYMLASDQNGNVWKEQAVAFMKQSLGTQGIALLLQDLQKKQKTAEEQEKEVHRDTRDDPEALYDRQIQESRQQTEEETDGAVTFQGIEENPIDKIREVKKMGILALVMPDSVSVSGKRVEATQLLSNRKENTGMGAQIPITFSPLEDVMYQEYCIQKLSCFGQMRGAGELDYQIEYILEGKYSDEENLKETVKRLLRFREASNYAYLAANASARQQCAAFALSLASAVGIPQASAVVEVVLRLCWAYGESLLDVRTLLSGGKVPLMKDQESWKLSVDRLFYVLEELKAVGKEQTESGMDYASYLRLLLFMQRDLSRQTLRSLDMIEGTVRKLPGKEAFRLDCCIQSLAIEGRVQDAHGRLYILARDYSYQM